SGNNYRLKDGKNKALWFEMQVDKEQIEDGTVALWLNNGAENRNRPVKPWRQNLGDAERDSIPCFNTSHSVVTPNDLPHITLRNEKDLREYAKWANIGNYINAVLGEDIKITSGKPWTPIGTKDHRWRGVFDGQGHTISGLKCTVKNGEEGAGLFGTVDVHADIRNVILDSSCEIENKSNTGAGGIVGVVRNNRRGWGNVLIRNCGNYGNVSGNQHVGGILGRVINDNNDGDGSYVQVALDSCFNAGSVKADGYSGLLCGYMQNYGVVTNCWSSGSLKQSGKNRIFSMNNPKGEAEYFVGYDRELTINKCYDKGSNVDWFNTDLNKRCQKGVEKVYTVTFDAGTGTCEIEKFTEKTNQDGVTLPTATPIEDWTFVGWSTEKIEKETNEDPTTIVGIAGGHSYMPKENITLYAVYSKDIIVDNEPMTIYNSLPENVSVTVSSAQYTTLYYSDKNLVVPEGIEA
ncbi:MAG: InlB B-repeat-containing protein, partial [Prevotella sp.]|nr:InlB B-repeat-containing protein [Prevotella sp.]